MKKEDVKPQSGNSNKSYDTLHENRNDEKASIGGDYNSGVTSEDDVEKEEIEKQASLGKNQPKSHKEREEEGDTGSGQKKDDN